MGPGGDQVSAVAEHLGRSARRHTSGPGGIRPTASWGQQPSPPGSSTIVSCWRLATTDASALPDSQRQASLCSQGPGWSPLSSRASRRQPGSGQNAPLVSANSTGSRRSASCKDGRASLGDLMGLPDTWPRTGLSRTWRGWDRYCESQSPTTSFSSLVPCSAGSVCSCGACSSLECLPPLLAHSWPTWCAERSPLTCCRSLRRCLVASSALAAARKPIAMAAPEPIADTPSRWVKTRTVLYIRLSHLMARPARCGCPIPEEYSPPGCNCRRSANPGGQCPGLIAAASSRLPEQPLGPVPATSQRDLAGHPAVPRRGGHPHRIRCHRHQPAFHPHDQRQVRLRLAVRQS